MRVFDKIGEAGRFRHRGREPFYGKTAGGRRPLHDARKHAYRAVVLRERGPAGDDWSWIMGHGSVIIDHGSRVSDY